MDENKQIEEMALAICRSRGVTLCKDCEGCWQDLVCLYQQIAMSLYGAGYRKQEWISVKDALPEEDVRALVWLSEKNPSKYTRIDTDRMLGGKWVRWECYVTHWMPLPEAPKGE